MIPLSLVFEDYKYKHEFFGVFFFIFLLVKYMQECIWQLCSWELVKETSTGFSDLIQKKKENIDALEKKKVLQSFLTFTYKQQFPKQEILRFD